MNIKLFYYAIFREQAKKSEEIIHTESHDLRTLYQELQKHYGFHLSERQLKVAVNDEFTSFDSTLKENDQVVFIPPVAGG